MADIASIVITAAVTSLATAALTNGITRWYERKTTADSLIVEMREILRKLAAYEDALAPLDPSDTAAASGRLESSGIPNVPITDADTLIYRSNTSKVGLLGDPAIWFIKFHQQLNDLRLAAEQATTQGRAQIARNVDGRYGSTLNALAGVRQRVRAVLEYGGPRLDEAKRRADQPALRHIADDIKHAVRWQGRLPTR